MFVLFTIFAAAAQATTAAQPAAPDSDPIICTKQNVGDEVGTHMRAKKKVCMRKSDRDFMAKEEKEQVLHVINDGNARMATPSETPR